MTHFYAEDGRVLTPPKELEPLLKGAFSAFSRLIGHIRFIYIADELWDGKSSLVFMAEGEQVVIITLDHEAFNIHIADKDIRIIDESSLNGVFEMLENSVCSDWQRPLEQRTLNLLDPNEYNCGYRCDICLVNKKYNENDFSGSEIFDAMNWTCYHDCVPNVSVDRNVHNTSVCPGCESKRASCPHYTCPTEKGYSNCAECGDYHSCDVFRDCHYPGQCNLGLTAEEITNLVIPYCMKERLDTFRNTQI